VKLFSPETGELDSESTEEDPLTHTLSLQYLSSPCPSDVALSLLPALSLSLSLPDNSHQRRKMGAKDIAGKPTITVPNQMN